MHCLLRSSTRAWLSPLVVSATPTSRGWASARVFDISPTVADVVIMDVRQLFFHIVCTYGGSPSDLIASFQDRLSHYPDGTNKIIVFDKYQDISAKDHERMRRTSESTLIFTSSLLKRDAIVKCKNNKWNLARLLSTFNAGANLTMVTRNDAEFSHDDRTSL